MIHGEDVFMAWLNAAVALVGFFAGGYALQRPALRQAYFVERLAVGVAVVALGLVSLVPLTGDRFYDVGKLLLTTSVTTLFVTWVYWSAQGRVRQRRTPRRQPARGR